MPYLDGRRGTQQINSYSQKRTVHTELCTHPSYLSAWAVMSAVTWGGFWHNSARTGWLPRNCICTSWAQWVYYLFPSARPAPEASVSLCNSSLSPLPFNLSLRVTGQQQSWSVAAVFPSSTLSRRIRSILNTDSKYQTQWQCPWASLWAIKATSCLLTPACP